MYQEEVVILANSIKHKQHCVAGKCFKTKKWIRPVSNQQGAELKHEQAKYENPFGQFSVKPLQRILMTFSEHVPLMHQPENYLVDGNLWKQNYAIKQADLVDYLDNPKDLWGKDNRVEHLLIEFGLYHVEQSLYLVKVDALNLYNNIEGKRRASFKYNDVAYDLAVTDPKFDEIQREGRNITGIICVSLGENHRGYCYKLVASIF